ncbi:MAG: LysR family transcriptional regulator [Clostridiales bacterium]|nr:LysR family transcriptional regulator [Clostridiales bacterium]
MIDNISLYKSFVAVAECGSISAAARSLYVSQPAISADIIALESKLKVKLFFRSSRGMTLNPEGRLLYDYISNAFSFINAGEEKLREVSGLRTGLLRVGASDMTLRFFLLDYIARFREKYPDVRLSVTNAPTPKTIEALRSGQIDFGVISEPVTADSANDLILVPVYTIRDIFVCSPKYEIAYKSGIGAEDLAGYPIMMLSGSTSTRQYVQSMMGPDFPPPDIELATSDLLLAFALRGIGIASIVEDFAAEALAAGRLVKLDMKKSLPPRRFMLVYLKKLPLSAAAKQIVAEITEGTAEIK